MSGFYAVRGFPSVIGCVDGTHVKIISPGQPDEAAYVNRKHQHSVNVQATCDHKGNRNKLEKAYLVKIIFSTHEIISDSNVHFHFKCKYPQMYTTLLIIDLDILFKC
jgi:hypothetical protein